MKHAKTITALGMLVALLPFLGFPSSWKGVIFAILGLTISTLSFRMLTQSKNPQVKEEQDQEKGQTTVGHIAEASVAHE